MSTKALPHRLRDGRCRDCGHYDSYSAPDTCTRCALERMSERGYEIVNPIQRWMAFGEELWRHVHQGILIGSIKSGRFYTKVGHNDGGPLITPLADCAPWEFPTALAAHRGAQLLTERYPQVWVVTTVGCWNAVRTEKE